MNNYFKAEEHQCPICDDSYEDIINIIVETEDYFGTDALTEQQQAFAEIVLKNEIPESCPYCMP